MIEIIIPTLNEASHLETLLSDLCARDGDVGIQIGPVRQQLLNMALVALYHLGVAPARLKQLYADARPLDRLLP